MNRRLAALAVAFSASLAFAASAEAVVQDSAVGAGTTAPSVPGGAFYTFDFDASISVFGGTPTGTAAIDILGIHFDGDVRCLELFPGAGGTSAIIGVEDTRGDDDAFEGFVLDVFDGGPAGSGLDTVNLSPSASVPSVGFCSAGPGVANQTVNSGDIVVSDLARPAARMVGKGTVPLSDLFGTRHATASYAYLLDCQAPHPNPRFEVRFEGHRFRLTSVDSVSCFDDASTTTPPAGFDTQNGSGHGTLDGTPGIALEWTFSDGGPGGANDSAGMSFQDIDPTTPFFFGNSSPPGKFPGSTQTTGYNTAQLLP